MRNYIPTGPLPEANARKQKRFIKVLLENGGFVERAIRECSTSRRWLNDQLDTDEDFTALYQAVRDQNNERIEEEIYRRAVAGNDVPQFNKGVPTGHVKREWSDILLMFYAKANMPEKYRDLPQKGQQLTDEELDARLLAYMKKRGRGAPAQPAETVH